MIKTSTKKNAQSGSKSKDVPDAKLEEFFYDSIKPALDKLKCDPEESTIQLLLNYSKKMD